MVRLGKGFEDIAARVSGPASARTRWERAGAFVRSSGAVCPLNLLQTIGLLQHKLGAQTKVAVHIVLHLDRLHGVAQCRQQLSVPRRDRLRSGHSMQKGCLNAPPRFAATRLREGPLVPQSLKRRVDCAHAPEGPRPPPPSPRPSPSAPLPWPPPLRPRPLPTSSRTPLVSWALCPPYPPTCPSPPR